MRHQNKAREAGWKNTLLGSDEANEVRYNTANMRWGLGSSFLANTTIWLVKAPVSVCCRPI